MVFDFHELFTKLNEYSLKNSTQVTTEHRFYPKLTWSGNLYVTCDGLSQLNENGSDVRINLERGMIEIRYGENKGTSFFGRLAGVFEGVVDGKDVLGVMIGDNIGPKSKDWTKKDDVLKAKKNLNVLRNLGLLNDRPDYLNSLEL